MRKLCSIVVVLFLALVSSYAQTGSVTLNVKLFPVQVIEVNSSQETVSLEYLTTEDYANGVQSDQLDHLSLYSTGGFVVKVMAMDLSGTDGTQIPANDIMITPLMGVANSLAGAEYSSVMLSNEGETIISHNVGALNKTFGINYRAKGNNEYINRYTDIENPTIFTTNVIYSIEVR